MPDATQDVHTYRAQQPNRYTDGRGAELTPPDAWIAAAVSATTIGELYDAALDAQRSGRWAERDAAWCRALRDVLGLNDRAALALLRKELGAELIAGGAS